MNMEVNNYNSSSYKEKMSILLESLVRHYNKSRPQQQQQQQRPHAFSRDLDLAITLATQQQQQQDDNSHDQMAQLGAIDVLSRFIIKSYRQQRQSPVPLTMHDIQKLCCLLFLFLQCNDTAAMESLEKVSNDLITTLLWIIVDYRRQPQPGQEQQLHEQGRVEEDGNSKDNNSNNKNVKNDWAQAILHRISRVTNLIVSRVDHGDCMIRFLQRIIRSSTSTSSYQNDESRNNNTCGGGGDDDDVQQQQQQQQQGRWFTKDNNNKKSIFSLEAMRLLDGWARNEQNKIFFMNVPNLVQDVIQSATVSSNNRTKGGRRQNNSNNNNNNKKKDWWYCCGVVFDFLVIRFLRKLAWDTRNKLRLCQTRGFVKFLMACSRHHVCMDIRKEAMGIFWLLSFDTASVQVLTTSTRDAAVVQTLVQAAQRPELQGLALPCLHRMISRRSSSNKAAAAATAPKQINQILMLLSHDSITRRRTTEGGGGSKQRNGYNHHNNKTEVYTARLVESLCRSTSIHEPCHSELMDALTTMSVSSCHVVRFWAAKAFHGQSINKVNQFVLARTPAVLQSIVQLATDPVGRVRERATLVLLQLTLPRANAKLLGYNYHLLEALLFNVRHYHYSHQDTTSTRSSSKRYVSKSSSLSLKSERQRNNNNNHHRGLRSTKKHHSKAITTTKLSSSPFTATRLSVQGILSLASQEVARPRIAKHHDCVSTLAAYGVSNDADIELRKAALHGVILLAHCL